MKRRNWIVAVFACLLPLLLSACITGETPFFETAKAATPLPADFVLLDESADEKKAWRLTLRGDTYFWQSKEDPMRTRLVALDTPGETLHVAILLEEGNETYYGLVRIAAGTVAFYAFDAGPVAAALGIATGGGEYTTKFETEAGLLAVFGDVAKRLPAEAQGKVKFSGIDFTVTRYKIYDLGNAAEAREGEALLAEFGKQPE